MQKGDVRRGLRWEGKTALLVKGGAAGVATVAPSARMTGVERRSVLVVT